MHGMDTQQGSETQQGMEAQPGRIVVIGASGALGSRIARGLGATHPLVLLVRDPSRLPADLARWPVHTVDLGRTGQLTEALGAAAVDGELSGIVHAAGVVAFGAYGETPPGIADELMRVNGTSVVEMLGAAAELVRSGGFVANLTGVAGEMTIAGMGAYCASKAAAAAAMGVAARELRRRTIRTLDIRLGHCETGLANRSLHGAPPRLPRGVDPDRAAGRIVRAILDGESRLSADDFAAG